MLFWLDYSMWRIRSWLLNPVVAAGLWLGLLGSFANNYVLSANGGMPVCGRLHRTGIHIPLTDRTQHNWLADWIHCGDRILSPGDLLIYAAILVGAGGILWGYIHAHDARRVS